MSQVVITQGQCLVQRNPRRICRIPYGPCCYSWTCSLECRNKRAWKEAGITSLHLTIYETRQLLIANLNPKAGLDGSEHEVIIKRFKKHFANHLPDAGYQLVAEFTSNGRLHWHGFIVGATVDQVQAAWASAARHNAGNTDIGPVKTTIEAAVAYAFKVRGDNRGSRIRLPAKGLHITPTHRFFKVKSKAALWHEFKANTYGGSG